MSYRQNLANEAIKTLTTGYIPNIRPACANYVSAMIRRAKIKGLENIDINYIPFFFNLNNFSAVNNINGGQIGDLIVFKETYDAVPPAGIGTEDDKTHIGIMINNSEFIHYSSTIDKPVRDKLIGYWVNKFECYLKISDEENKNNENKTGNEVFSLIKCFYHPKSDKVNSVIDGITNQVYDMILTMRSDGKNEVSLISHYFEKNPYLVKNGEVKKVVSIDINIKCE